jgi:translocation and assembly module TamB
LRFDLRLRNGEPFRVDSNVARGSLRPNLALTGTGRAPVLTGALFLDPTSIPLPAATLELRSGTLALDRRDPLDPTLDFSMSTRVRGFDVQVRVAGRYSEPELELSSMPPLSSEDILLLLLTGRAPGAALAGDDAVDAAETVIVYLGKDLLSRLFEGEGSMMERVEVQTGADVTQNGGSTAQVRIRVHGKAEGEGRAIYLRGERDIYERINFGVRFVMRLR